MYSSSTDRGIGWGVDRPIRSDEWLVRLPWLAGQATRNFHSDMVTAGTHDASITYDLPVRDLGIALKPHLIPYLFLDFDRAVSAEWWFLVFGCAVAVYLFLLKLRISAGLAASLAVFVMSSPGLHWWTVNPSFDLIMYTCLGASAVLMSLTCRSSLRASLLAALGGWLFACSAVVLYPPFQIPTFVTIALVLLIYVWQGTDRSLLSRIVRTVVPTCIVFALAVGCYLLYHREGLRAIAGTVYPGLRRSTSGGVDFASLFGVPFDLRASQIVAGSVNRTNQSENSSTFLLVLPVLLMLPSLATIRRAGLPGRLMILVSGWVLILLSWMLLPLPQAIGRLTLLDRVPPDRLKPSVLLTSVIVVGLFLGFFKDSTQTVRRVTASVAFSALTLCAGAQYLVNDVPLPHSAVWGLSTMWLVPMAITFLWSSRVGMWLLAVVSVFTSAHINPLHTSTNPLRGNGVYEQIVKSDPLKRNSWITFSGTAQIRGIMVAAGMHVESAVSPYPDAQFWSRYDPTGMFEQSWNRYGHVHFTLTTGETVISSPQSDVITIGIDPCAIDSPIKSGSFFVEAPGVSIPCARTLSKVDYQGVTWSILRKD